MNPITVVFVSGPQCSCLFLKSGTPGSCENKRIDNVCLYFLNVFFFVVVWPYFRSSPSLCFVNSYLL